MDVVYEQSFKRRYQGHQYPQHKSLCLDFVTSDVFGDYHV